jgi:hypothetical protein
VSEVGEVGGYGKDCFARMVMRHVQKFKVKKCCGLNDRE